MPKVTTNQTDVSYAEQSNPGEIPATPIFNILPTTGGSPASDITTEVSAIIRSDRQIDDLVPVDAEVGGDIEYEVAYLPFKPLFIQLLRNTLSTPINETGAGTTTVAGATIDVIGATFVSTGVKVGQFLKVTGFTDPTNDRIYKVTAVTETQLTVDPPPATDDTGTVTVTGSMVRNGANPPVLNTFVKRIQSTSDYFFYYIDSIVSWMSLNFETGSILSGTMNLMGTTENATTTPVAGQSFDDPPAYAILNSVDNIVEVGIEGLPTGTCFQALNLRIDNGSEGAKCIGTLGATENQDFSWEITGDIEAYFEDLTLYNKFKNSESFSLYVWLRDSLSNEMVVSMPVCKFETLAVPIPGKDQFLTMPGSIRALRDQTNDYTIQFDFFDAP